LVVFKRTDTDVPRGTALITGMPRAGKTILGYKLARHLIGCDDVFVMDWPEEEGTATLSDCNALYTTVQNFAQLNELYDLLSKEVKPKAIIWDGLKASYDLFQKEKCPAGMPEDHGKTWNLLAQGLRKEITRFKMLPSVEWFVATSLVWPDTDEVTGQAGRIQVTLPGQLKGSIYGLFSYNMNIAIMDSPSGPSRVLELQPTARTVAGVRAPLSKPVKPRLMYDLSKPGMDIAFICKELGLEKKERVDESNPKGEERQAAEGAR
jgi:hypothetical protein